MHYPPDIARLVRATQFSAAEKWVARMKRAMTEKGNMRK